MTRRRRASGRGGLATWLGFGLGLGLGLGLWGWDWGWGEGVGVREEDPPHGEHEEDAALLPGRNARAPHD
jgi:hypothetical protein